MAELTEGPEDELYEELRAVLHRADPVPAAVEEAARASFTWRTVDAELAELAYDSALDDDRLAGVRSVAAGPRTVTFEGAGVTVEVEVAEEGGRRRLLGQLVPPGVASVDVRHGAGVVTVTADEVGRFTVEALPPGPVSLRCTPAGGGAAVETSWLAF